MYAMQEKLTLKNLSKEDILNKRVLVRVDFNVPVDDAGNITDDSRIRASLPTIQWLIEKGAKVILMSHFGRPKGKDPKYSLQKVSTRLASLLKKPVVFIGDSIGKEVESLIAKMNPGSVLLLENLRFYPAEEKPESDPSFAQKLGSLGDIYINDAFGAAHRAHSSTYSIAKYFPHKAASGFLLEKEIAFLGKTMKNPERPFHAIIGGAKVSTKIGVLKALAKEVDALFIGGAMAYTFFKAQGIPMGDSLVEDDALQEAINIIEACKENKTSLYLPLDIVAAVEKNDTAAFKTFLIPDGIPPGYQGVDIGDKTIAEWSTLLKKAKTIFWNGPVGVFECKNFAKGTFAIANLLKSLSNVTTIVGGGDSLLAIERAKATSSISHLSTGGGASLEYIEKGTLPGIEALSDS